MIEGCGYGIRALSYTAWVIFSRRRLLFSCVYRAHVHREYCVCLCTYAGIVEKVLPRDSSQDLMCKGLGICLFIIREGRRARDLYSSERYCLHDNGGAGKGGGKRDETLGVGDVLLCKRFM